RSSAAGVQVEVAALDETGMTQRRAWIKGFILLRHGSIPELVEQFNRYSRTQFALEEFELDVPPISGAVQIRGTEEFLRFITHAYPFEVTESGPPHARVIHLRKRIAEDGR